MGKSKQLHPPSPSKKQKIDHEPPFKPATKTGEVSKKGAAATKKTEEKVLTSKKRDLKLKSPCLQSELSNSKVDQSTHEVAMPNEESLPAMDTANTTIGSQKQVKPKLEKSSSQRESPSKGGCR